MATDSIHWLRWAYHNLALCCVELDGTTVLSLIPVDRIENMQDFANSACEVVADKTRLQAVEHRLCTHFVLIAAIVERRIAHTTNADVTLNAVAEE